MCWKGTKKVNKGCFKTQGCFRGVLRILEKDIPDEFQKWFRDIYNVLLGCLLLRITYTADQGL